MPAAAALLTATLWAAPPAAADVLYLQDGRTVQVERVEVQGDLVRVVTRAGERLDLPRREVLSIHVLSPTPAPSRTPPAAAYPDFVQQMTDRVRNEIGSNTSAGPSPR
ncbi:MAG: hypothetical protein ACE147_13895 [Candidatus Methylomirabilales bacterium]